MALTIGRIRQVAGRSLSCLDGCGVEAFAGPEGYVDESDQDGCLDQGDDHTGEGFAGGNPKTPMATAMAS